MKNFELHIDYARNADQNDQLSNLKNLFNFPKNKPMYFCGHSLGLQPIQTKKYINEVLNNWSDNGVQGHIKGDYPWFDYHTFLTEPMAKLVGAKPSEVVVMNSLTTNLHLLMLSFFEPKNNKDKIIIDIPSFPSDKYAVQSQLRLKNLDINKNLIEINTFEGISCKSNDEILYEIEKHIENAAMILFSGVNYYTGQLYDIKSISNLAKKYDCIFGLDLAHAAGNVDLKLNEWGVDFAAWCGYKYLNGGPGAPSGIFIHEKYNNKNLNRLEGWWGHEKNDRFNPPKVFSALKGAEAWQLSNPPILSMAGLRSSLDLFDNVDFNSLIKKRKSLTNYLEYLIKNTKNNCKIITPSSDKYRGAQLSIIIDTDIDDIPNYFKSKNIICDFRKPNVMRIAPTPFYNTFEDVYNFVIELNKI